jgi:hypothetical protein
MQTSEEESECPMSKLLAIVAALKPILNAASAAFARGDMLPVLLISALFNLAQLGAKPVGQAVPLDLFVDDLEPASEGGDYQVKGVKMALAHGNGSTLSSLWTGNLRSEETL